MKPDFTRIKPDLIKNWSKEELIDFVVSLLTEMEELKTYKMFMDLLLRKASETS
jgi:hypothetical protein